MKLVDRTGQRFGRLVVLEQAGRTASKKVLWKCKCDCGNETQTDSGSLVTGNTESCGCILKEAITKHGGWKKSSYNTWRAMIRRCNNPKDKNYPKYGGKGVSVCPEWLDYATFAKDMGEPQGDETLDRIDVYGNYEPSNCRWAGLTQQARNVRVRANSETGVTGVVLYKNRYYAKITVKKKNYYSKVFNTIEEAAEARKELERIHWVDR
jgi:hypothetical protein